MFVDAVTSAIPLENFIEAKCTNICAFSNNFLCFSKQISFKCFQGIIGLELHEHCLASTGVEDIYDAGLHEFMKSEGVMAAIVKDFED